MTRIADTFAELKSRSQTAFMPFLTAGDPDLETTVTLIRALSRRGVNLIEIGFPYSDPIADGPVIQASYTRALEKKLHVDDIFAAIRALTEEGEPLAPLVAMVSCAIIFRTGPEAFLDKAAAAGFAGLIVPDLPGDEAGEFSRLVKVRNLDLVQLVAPTTPPERVKKILQSAGGFLYCISIAGTTGVRDELPPELAEHLKRLRAQTDLPLAVGFGISKPEQVQALKGLADGVIVGSAIVQRLRQLSEENADTERLLAEIGDYAESMVAACRA